MEAEAHNSMDDVIAVYKRDVDRTLLEECRRRTVEERLQALQNMINEVDELRAAVRDSE